MSEKKVISVNRQARFNYFISDTYEAGIVLSGSEVKSIRLGNASIKDAYVRVAQGEVFVIGMHIRNYDQADATDLGDPTRTRKLLLHKKEIGRLTGTMSEKGLTCVPLSLYFKRGRVKLEIGVAKGKKMHDKRESIKKKQQDREVRQAVKRRVR